MNKLPEQIVRELLDDDKFVDECKENLLEILKDKKFDSSDMPEVISLVVLLVEKYDSFDVNEDDVSEVLKMLVMELIKKLDLAESVNEEIEKMLDACLKLVVLKVKSKKVKSGCVKLFSCFGK
jgi:RecJ-like exonuclease